MVTRSSSKGGPTPKEEVPPLKGGVQSVEIGMQVLGTLADRGGEETLGMLARATGMPAAKAHRYLASLVKAGFVERNLGKYVLGPQALRVGLVALGRLDVVETVTPALYELRDKIDGTVMLALWGENGPTIVRWIESMRPVTVNVRVGSVMPLIRSATGQVFCAFLPETMTRALLTAELPTAKKQNLDIRTLADARAMFAAVREKGLGHTAGAVLSGVLGLAAPIFDHNGSLAAVIACLGPVGFFDDSLDGETARALRDTANDLSRRLGHRAPERQPRQP